MKPYGLWPKQEFDLRWRRAHDLMREKGLDALLVSNFDNYHWLTGAKPPAGWMRRCIAILPLDAEPVMIVREHYVEMVRLTSFATDIRGHTEDMERPYPSGPARVAVQLLKEMGLDEGVIGAELTAPYTPGLMYDEIKGIQDDLPKAKFVSSADLFIRLRMIKSQREIQACRRACEITDKTHERIPELVVRGKNQRELADLLYVSMEEQGGFTPFVYFRDGSDGVGAVGTHKGYKDTAANRPLREGYLLVDMGCSYEYYWSDFSRHYWIGDPPDKAKSYAKASQRSIDKALEKVKPGVKSREIIKAVYDELARLGIGQLDKVQQGMYGLIGHTIGLDVVDGIMLTEDTPYPLQENMVITLEPMFLSEYGHWIPEVDLVVTSKGYELLCGYPTDLIQIR